MLLRFPVCGCCIPSAAGIDEVDGCSTFFASFSVLEGSGFVGSDLDFLVDFALGGMVCFDKDYRLFYDEIVHSLPIFGNYCVRVFRSQFPCMSCKILVWTSDRSRYFLWHLKIWIREQ